jgi:mono/diheme cytochrome c family protein
MSAHRRVRAFALASLVLVAGAGAAHAQDAATVARGGAKFAHSCAPCHGAGPGDDGRAMLPGTDALRIKYKGELPALIERRTDLTAPVLKVFVRRGSWSMPPFRPTELTDDEIADIAAYIEQTARAAASAARR